MYPPDFDFITFDSLKWNSVERWNYITIIGKIYQYEFWKKLQIFVIYGNKNHKMEGAK